MGLFARAALLGLFAAGCGVPSSDAPQPPAPDDVEDRFGGMLRGASGCEELRYWDGDGDGYGNPTVAAWVQTCLATPTGWVTDGEDCNDGNSAITPATGAENSCDGIDDDCDGVIDDGVTCAVQSTPCSKTSNGGASYLGCSTSLARDSALDECSGLGYHLVDIETAAENAFLDSLAPSGDYWTGMYGDGGANVWRYSDDAPLGGYTNWDSGYPNDDSTCVAFSGGGPYWIDEDCGTDYPFICEAEPPCPTWWADNDGDGFGAGASTQTCTPAAGYVRNSADCDDTDEDVHPGAPEVCNSVDDDCDNYADEDGLWWRDADGDGYGNPRNAVAGSCAVTPSGYVNNNTDCNDGDRFTYVGATETCDGIDNDCDGQADESVCFPGSSCTTAWYEDGVYQICDAGSTYDAAKTICAGSGYHLVVPEDEAEHDWVFQKADDAGLRETWIGLEDPTQTEWGWINGEPLTYERWRTSEPDTGDTCAYFHTSYDIMEPWFATGSCSANANYGFVCEYDCGSAVWFEDADGDGYGDPDGGQSTACQQPSGYADNNDDCDDSNDTINPGMVESCDSIDNNCDGVIDELVAWFEDADGDGFGGRSVMSGCALPPPISGNWVLEGGDCQDGNGGVHPDATEDCDGVDNDCDGVVDLPGDCGLSSGQCFSDSWGTSNYMFCDVDVSWQSAQSDCSSAGVGYNLATVDSSAENTYVAGQMPNIGWIGLNDLVTEDVYAWIDGTPNNGYYHWAQNEPSIGSLQDCVALGSSGNWYDVDCIDSTLQIADYVCERCIEQVWFLDEDGDGYGAPGMPAFGCDPPAGATYASNNLDCDDSDASVYANAVERADDGVDQDCDGWDLCANADRDGDGVGDSDPGPAPAGGCPATSNDCDDDEPSVYPGAPELCDGLDNDCDANVDEGALWYADFDGDGFGAGDSLSANCASTPPPNYSWNNFDCDDRSEFVSPEGEEVCDTRDNDCDGQVDEYVSCEPNGDECYRASRGDDEYFFCSENRGWSRSSRSCEAMGYHLATIDNAEENSWLQQTGIDLVGATAKWVGYTDAAVEGVWLWEDGSTSQYTNWDTGEGNDGSNQNCAYQQSSDGKWVDNACGNQRDYVCEANCEVQPWFRDVDGDGYGDFNRLVWACSAPAGYVGNRGDCRDTDAAVYPGANVTEVPGDLTDSNCDGAELCYVDNDGDGVGSTTTIYVPYLLCGLPGVSPSNDDCDDSDSTRHAMEVCGDGIDNNCDGHTDEGQMRGWLDRDGDGDGDPDSQWVIDCTEAIPSNAVFNDDDCDDANPDATAGATEVCDGADNDCNGIIDDSAGCEGANGGCTQDWYDGHSYLHCVSTTANWSTAQSNCQALGYELAHVEDSNEDSFLDGLAGSYNGWIGGSDQVSEGNFVWTDGRAVTYFNWSATEPSGDDCMILMPTGLWEDQPCTNTRGYFCESCTQATWYQDADGDGFGADGTATFGCPPNGDDWILLGGDCDDSDYWSNPDALEICGDGNDNDCNGVTDTFGYYFADNDNDGFGDPAALSMFSACGATAPAGSVSNSEDCDDTLGVVSPNGTESCNAMDDDCDGMIDESGCNAPACTQVARDGSSYLFCSDGRDWQSARDACYALGYHLVIVDDEAEDDFLYDHQGANSAWIGLSDLWEEGAFLWLDGSGLSYAAWADGQPDDFVNHDCGILSPVSDGWTDQTCRAENAYICELECETRTWYIDIDGDGYGDPTVSVSGPCLDDYGWVLNSEDCDDGAPTVHPGIGEACNGIDDNCDGQLSTAEVDQDGDLYVACAIQGWVGDDGIIGGEDCDPFNGEYFPNQVWYVDCDGDGDAEPGLYDNSCLPPSDGACDGGDPTGGWYHTPGGDCDDTDPNNFSGNNEVCDEQDNNCDGSVDEGVTDTWYYDGDMDGFGDAGNSYTGCTQPSFHVSDNTDCNDANSEEFPGQLWVPDCDGDNYYAQTGPGQCSTPFGWCAGADPIGGWAHSTGTDCDDNDVAEFPGQDWYADCDDDNDPAPNSSGIQCEAPKDDCNTGPVTWYHNPGGDCDDEDAAVSSGGSEVCDDKDNDCNGSIDDGLLFTDYWQDLDGDGYGDPAPGPTSTCDGPPSSPPDWVEDDQDCNDGSAEEFPGQVWYADCDGDSFTDDIEVTNCLYPDATFASCDGGAPPSNWEHVGEGDCDDNNALTYLGAGEICDDEDNNCDGSVDEGLTFYSYFLDNDADGFGDATNSLTSCQPSPPSGYVSDDTDCNDLDGDVYPGNLEVCDGVDNDCNFQIDDGFTFVEYWPDPDSDGYGGGTSTLTCDGPPGSNFVTNGDDCDNSDSEAFPGQVWYADCDGDGETKNDEITSCLQPADVDAACTGGGAPSNWEHTPEGDCDDDDIVVFLGNPEACDLKDNDCNGQVDDGVVYTDYWPDTDGDGYGDMSAASSSTCDGPPSNHVADNTDCDDGDPDQFPGQVWYPDCDGDGDTKDTLVDSCAVPPDASAGCQGGAAPAAWENVADGDCDDDNSDIYPGNPEVCDGEDNDCNGIVDDELTFDDWYVDSDGDGYGDVSTLVSTCDGAPGTNYVANSTDCVDSDEFQFPGQVWYADCDGDGYAKNALITQCAQPANFAAGCTGGGAPSDWLHAPGGDCGDNDVDIYPGNPEVCDGKDNDCVGGVDNGVLTTYYHDFDGDGFGDPNDSAQACSAPSGHVTDNTDCDDDSGEEFPGQVWFPDCEGDGYFRETPQTSCLEPQEPTTACTGGTTPIGGWDHSVGDDCNDSDPNVNIGVAEDVCNNVDDNCDSNIDEGRVDADFDGVDECTDCDDNDEEVAPGLTEVCDGKDNNCNTVVDEGVETTFYADTDMDGYGDPTVEQQACSAPSGFVANDFDCDDGNDEAFPNQEWYADCDNDGFARDIVITQCLTPPSPCIGGNPAPDWYHTAGGDCADSVATVYPGQTEDVCNGIDDNCELGADEGRDDADGDGSDECDDCNDADAEMKPGLAETCDGKDNDCNSVVDDGVKTRFYLDDDGDGFGDAIQFLDACTAPTDYVLDNTDCDDGNALEFPGQTWYADCDGDTYSNDTRIDSCTVPTGACSGGAEPVGPWAQSPEGDCDDADIAINPGAADTVCNDIDDNCDGAVDETNANADSDPADECTDCDESDATVYPGAPELCDNKDNDCNTLIDDAQDYYPDMDGDGQGDIGGTPINGCNPPANYVANNTDCDDADAQEFAGQVWYPDCDGDGYASDVLEATQCETPATAASCGGAPSAWYHADGGDCADDDTGRNPVATDLDCNDVDDDCDGDVDEDRVNLDGDSADECTDCDDTDAERDPLLPEVCDGKDNNCDASNLVDEGVESTFYADVDGDGFGDPNGATEIGCTPTSGFVDDATDCNDANAEEKPGQVWYADCDGDTVADDTGLTQCAQPVAACDGSEPLGTWVHAPGDDCDDTAATTYPGATEDVCNLVDDNCNGSADEGRKNTDGDPADECSDCDDNDNRAYPGNPEICDGVDNNCDSAVDENLTSVFYADSDGDGRGDVNTPIDACTQPAGYVTSSDDCDDTDAANFPQNDEVCDLQDNNCDTVVDEGVKTTFYLDSDGDNYGHPTASEAACTAPANHVANNSDCNDSQPEMFPGNPERCDGLDNNCDGTVDEGVKDPFYRDVDMDGHGDPTRSVLACSAPPGYVDLDDDCDDNEPASFLGNEEICDGIDNNCDTVVDEGLLTTYHPDADGDSYGDADPNEDLDACTQPDGYVLDNTDCDDSSNQALPGGTEVCDGLDNDCQNGVDDGVLVKFYLDADRDDFGLTGSMVEACTRPPGYGNNPGDCDDNDAQTYPGADEQCNGTDNNCNGTPDDGVTYVFWYPDLDGDGHGVDDPNPDFDCAQPANTARSIDDCDDSDPDNFPGNDETCDGADNDCDTVIDNGVLNTWYLDSDGDSYGDAASSFTGCTQPTDHVADDSDCDDGEALSYPGNPEVCDGLDNDCLNGIDDGVLPIWYADSDGDSFGDVGDSLSACTQPTGYVADSTDCNDASNAAYPGGTEICDGLDNNCNTLVDDDDEDFITGQVTRYSDGDGDLYGDITTAYTQCDPVLGTDVEVAGDCNDANNAINPDAIEVCDDKDNDCDGDKDDDDADVVATNTYYLDSDADGFGDVNNPVPACLRPAGYVNNSTDCDDSTDAVSPDDVETCNGVDDDCDGTVDNGVGPTWYADNDGDGFGDIGMQQQACAQPTGYVADDSDCDDGDAMLNPDADELCDGLDNDCTGFAEDDFRLFWYGDLDGDGYGDVNNFQYEACQPLDFVADDTDCDDTADTTYPGATELCNTRDDDCDGTADEGVATQDWYLDLDGDGYGTSTSVNACAPPPGFVDLDTDCDDTDDTVHPNATEFCDPIDHDCDGNLANDVVDVNYYIDADGDGYGDPATARLDCAANSNEVDNGLDCDDTDIAINPDATEVCDGADNDCDGTSDIGATDETTWYGDDDGDGEGDPNDSVVACDQPPGLVDNATDCDDTNATVNSNGIELCDGLDNDCDGQAQDDFGQSLWWADRDGDGYGDSNDEQMSCLQPFGFVPAGNAADCEDSNALANPGATETCSDGVDNDCNGIVDDFQSGVVWYADTDGDAWGDAAVTSTDCNPGPGWVTVAGDCDDSSDSVFPSAFEQCNSIDDDCDGVVDDEVVTLDWYADADGDGWGDAGSVTSACVQPADTVLRPGDCDDGDDTSNPSAQEICDGVDNDCDGDFEDYDSEAIWYTDADGDGFGDETTGVEGCGPPDDGADYVLDEDGRHDCDDDDATTHPDAVDEPYDDFDTNCDGEVVWDVDGDGYDGPSGEGDDCDDNDPNVYPGADDKPGGADNDCNGYIDPQTEVHLKGCGCTTTDSTSPLFLILLAAAALRRREVL